MNVLVGRGEVELMFSVGAEGQETLEFAPEFDRRRWIESGCIPVDLALTMDYQADIPPCEECFYHKLCRDIDVPIYDLALVCKFQAVDLLLCE